MGRIILASTVGVVVAFATITVSEYLLAVFPPPATAGPIGSGPVVSLPLAWKLLVVAGWLIGSLVGSAVAGRIARRAAIGWVPAVMVAIAGIANVTMIPHPLWMSIAAIVAPLLGGWLGTRLARPRPRSVMPA